MATQVEELPDNKVRLTVDVPSEDVHHAVEHAASDLASSVKVPGFRQGKVPMPVLRSHIGKERLLSEAIESHISGWFWNAAARERIRPVEQPELDYELPDSEESDWHFTATVSVLPKPEVADWTKVQVPYAEPEVPEDFVDHELNVLRSTVAELKPAEGRAAEAGDTIVLDLIADEGGQRDYVVELGSGRLLPDLEEQLVGMGAGETKEIELERGGEGEPIKVEAVVKEIKEKVLPELDDELARSASEFDTLEELRADIEQRIRAQLDLEIESAFRTAVADALVDAAKVDARGPLVEARARELERGLVRSLAGRGVSADAYLQLTGQSIGEVQQRLRTEAERSVARELVLEAIADELDIQVSDDELREFLREEAAPGEDADALIEQVFEAGRQETLRDDLRLRRALDRAASEVKRIPADLAAAREKLWTPEKERPKTETKLWTPGSKEP
jgi:trigger factor